MKWAILFGIVKKNIAKLERGVVHEYVACLFQLVEGQGQSQVVQQQISMAQHEPTQQHHQTVTVVSSMPSSMAHQVCASLNITPEICCADTCISISYIIFDKTETECIKCLCCWDPRAVRVCALEDLYILTISVILLTMKLSLWH